MVERIIYPIRIAAWGGPMTQYSDAGIEALLREQPKVLDQIRRVIEQAVQQSAFAANERAREYLRSGAGRRLRVLHRTLSNMFELFPD